MDSLDLLDPPLLSRRVFLKGLFSTAVCLTLPGPEASLSTECGALADLELWQLPPQGKRQSMSYVLKGDDNAVFVVDGGAKEDAGYLKRFLKGMGGAVTAWWITHPHDDHVGALCEILLHAPEIEVGAYYGSIPDESWVSAHEPARVKNLQHLATALGRAGKAISDLPPGAVRCMGGLKFEVFGVRNPEITRNALNNSSMVFRVTGRDRSVLFLGDLGVEGGKKLLASSFGNRLGSDAVQMAHHGQAGVGPEVYAAIDPKVCLWPTPRWLWENDAGPGPGSGKWETPMVKKRMDERGVKRHIVAAEGLGHL